MNNLFKNFYCDLVVFKIANFTFTQKIKLILDKYLYFARKILGMGNINLLGNRYIADDSFGLLGLQIMLKDYWKYYFVKNLQDSVIIDVGAHIGNFSIASNIFYAKCRIFSIEPVKSTYDILVSNTKNYGNIKAFNIAIGSENENKEIFFSDNEKDRSSFFADNIIKKDSIQKEIVEVKTLSKFIQENGIDHVDLLKIDVEGFEREVISGSISSLEMIDWIIIEIHHSKNLLSFSEINNILSEKGFRIHRFGKMWLDKGRQINTFDVIYQRVC